MRRIPKHLVFENLKPGEEVKLFLRRHVIVLWQRITLLLLVGIVPIIAWIVLVTQTTVLDNDSAAFRVIIVFIVSLFYLFWARLLFTVWLDYYLDVWVVTTERIMNINHEGLFHRKVSQQLLSRVQDVTTETKGWLQTLMHFGDIHVQTAAETEHFVFQDIEEPEEVAQLISELHANSLQKEFHAPGDTTTHPQQQKPEQEVFVPAKK